MLANFTAEDPDNPGSYIFYDNPDYDFQKHYKVADVNGDGKSDLIHFRNENYLNTLISNGDGTFTINSRFPQDSTYPLDKNDYNFQVGDFNGDGKADLIHLFDNDEVRVWHHSEGEVPDLLSQITSSLGAKTRISYKSMTQDAVYTRDNDNPAYPVRNVQAPFYLTSSVESSNGLGTDGYARVDYSYQGAKQHVSGRGFLGFRQISTTDPQTGVTTVTEYRQDFPFIGRPLWTEVRTGNNRLLSRSDNSWNTYLLHGNEGNMQTTWFPYLETSVEKVYDLVNFNPSSPVFTVTTQTRFYVNGAPTVNGNPTQITITKLDPSFGSYTATTDNVYEDDLNPNNWRPGKLKKKTITATRPDSSKTRVSSFEYHPVTGLPVKEIDEPGTALEQSVSYEHDSYGNIYKTTKSGADITNPRISYNWYQGGKGRFVTSAVNALGHTTTINIGDYNAFGAPTQSTDANGVTTSWLYDSFGRQIEELRGDGTTTQIQYEWCDGDCPDTGVYRTITQTTGKPDNIKYYDMLGRQVREQRTGFDGTPVNIDTVYDSLSRVSAISEPYYVGDAIYWQHTEYDILGRIVRMVFPDNSLQNPSILENAYNGLTTTITNQKGQVSIETKNVLGELMSVTDDHGNTTSYDYTPFGKLDFIEDAYGNQSATVFDNRGRPTSINDPDKGLWTYTYNAFNELTSQTDPKGQTIFMFYDKLGRLERRETPGEIETIWDWDSPNGIGQLEHVVGPDFERWWNHDTLGRIASTSTSIDGVLYSETIQYQSGRVWKRYDPTGRGIEYFYNTYGYMDKIKDADSGYQYWQVLEQDARSNITMTSFGNGLTGTRDYSPQLGHLQSIATNQGQNGIQDLAYQFDSLGNLLNRQDNRQGLVETFGYDSLNRMISSQVSGLGAKTYQYDAIGNLTLKDGATYHYDGTGGAGPHAVTQLTGSKTASYSYDLNGNMTTGDGLTIQYSPFDKPTRIERVSAKKNDSEESGFFGNGAPNVSEFSYDPDRDRFKRVDTAPDGAITTTLYVGNLEYVTYSDGRPSQVRRYIEGIALEVQQGVAPVELYYMHHDHLGSLDLMTDEFGSVVQYYSFDPYGKRRNTNWTDAWSAAILGSDITNLGFTGHEQLDNLNLVHMNGRIYDPTLGRFLQADAFAEIGGDPQGLNRYTYVRNNPLSYTDPTGHFLKKLYENKIFRALLSLGVNYISGSDTLVGAWFREIFRGYSNLAAGYISGAIGSGSLRGGLIGAFSTGIHGEIRQSNLSTIKKFGAHALAGGVLAVLGGGDFGNGFLTAGILESFQTLAAIKPGAGSVHYLVRDHFITASGKKIYYWVDLGEVNGIITEHVAINGILNSFEKAVQLMGDHMIEAYGDGVEKMTLLFNPTDGFLIDGLETLRDKLGFTTDITKQFSGVLMDAKASGLSVTVVAHSQGSVIFSEAIRTSNTSFTNMRVTFHGEAVNHFVTRRILRDAGVQLVGSGQFKGGFRSHPFDAVSTLIGFNTINPIRIIGSILYSPLLKYGGRKYSPHTLPYNRVYIIP